MSGLPDCPLCNWYRSEGEANGCTHLDCDLNPFQRTPLVLTSQCLVGGLGKHALDHQGERSPQGGAYKVESREADTYSPSPEQARTK